jgi:hypothetical protein
MLIAFALYFKMHGNNGNMLSFNALCRKIRRGIGKNNIIFYHISSLFRAAHKSKQRPRPERGAFRTCAAAAALSAGGTPDWMYSLKEPQGSFKPLVAL